MTRYAVALVLLCSISVCTAWWCHGHMLVASIASQTMCPGTTAYLNKLVQTEAMYTPRTPDFIQGACWADDIKPTNKLYDNLHFTNLPLINRLPPSGSVPAPDYNNILWAIKTVNSTLRSRKDATQSDVARAIFLLTHFVGDLHQPLHVTTLFSDKFPAPRGDLGGNLYNIRYNSYTNLHAFWDSGADQWPGDVSRPLNIKDYQSLNETTVAIMQEYPVSTFEKQLKIYDTMKWATESFELSRDVAYTAPEAPATLPKDYVAQAQQTCASQVALGGYRLAQLFTSILGCMN